MGDVSPRQQHDAQARDGSVRGQPLTAPKLAAFAVAALAGFATLVGLGVWQSQRLVWKHDLIERVEQRVHASPVAPPERSQWPSVDVANSEYLRVRIDGRFRHDRETLVQAVTERGGGFWVITPLETLEGYVVLVNRGFVLPTQVDSASRPQGQVEGTITITGLLRLSEPGGGYLRSNQPAEGRWYSRDVPAIAAARGLGEVAPYFIDAEASSPEIAGAPVGGLTVIAFSDNHLQYALTWFALALLLAAGAGLVFRHEWHLRRPPNP